MCYVNLLESIEQYIAYTHVVYICVCYAYLSFTHPIVYDFFCCLRSVEGNSFYYPYCWHMEGLGEATGASCAADQGPPTSCRGTPLSLICAGQLDDEGLGEGKVGACWLPT